jgi:hypothetical protein
MRWVAAIAVISLAACGGGGDGGGGGGGASGVTFDPPVLEATFVEFGQGLVPGTVLVGSGGAGITVTAHFATPPDGPVVIVMAADQPVIEEGLITTSNPTVNSLTLELPFSTSLAAGTYTGQIQVLLCRDLNCQSQYPASGAFLPYSFTVLPGIQLTVAVNGQPVADWRAGVMTRDGDLLEMTSNVPVRWSQPFSSGGFVSDVQETATTWRGRARYGISTSGGVGSFGMAADTDLLSMTPFRIQVTE